MTTDLEYFELDIADIYNNISHFVANDLLPKDIAEKLNDHLQLEIVTNGELFCTYEEYLTGDEKYKAYYLNQYDSFKLVRHDVKEALLLDYFFTNKGGYEYFQSVPIKYNNPNFSFWFGIKLFTYEQDLTLVDKFLRFQLDKNYSSSKADYLLFLNALINQYNEILYPTGLVKTIEDWIVFTERHLLQSTPATQSAVIATKTVNIKSKDIRFNAFLLKSINQDPEFLIRNPNCLLDVYSQLTLNSFLFGGKQYLSFRKLLSNQKIPETEKIIWQGAYVELKWFVNILLKESELLEPVGKDLWLIVTKCFVNKNGGAFSIDQIKSSRGGLENRQQLLRQILKPLNQNN